VRTPASGYHVRMLRRQLFLIATVGVLLVAIPAATSARATRPRINYNEVGYFGNANVAHEISVFVYSHQGPGVDHVTVCYRGHCEAAVGHNASLSWYQASFSSPPLRMGHPVTYTIIARNSAGKTRRTVTKGLLCMHNDGSTPQKS
jgi:hypothetical protein